MRPRVVLKTTLLPKIPERRGHAGQRPEHNFTLPLKEWEMAVFDNAVNFSVAWFYGRFNNGRHDFGLDIETAMVSCLNNERSCLYASTEAGRSICIDRADFDKLLRRWKISHGIED